VDRRSNWFWGLGLVVILAITFFQNRFIFVYKFDPGYWENFYYHSQYNIPNSSRVIGDGGVYQYVGYRLVMGENPFNIDYWVPPLGKYLFGLGARYGGNPLVVAIAVYIFSLILLFIISKKLIGKRGFYWLPVYFLALNPLLISQVRGTLLDSIQMFLILIHLLLLFKIKNIKGVVMAGLVLGLIAGVKVGLFVPIIIGADLVWFYKLKKLKWVGFLIGGLILGYMGSYFCYFSQHPNPIPWLRLHQKIIDFWQSGGQALNDPLGVLRYIFVKGDSSPLEWTPILPIGVVLTIIYLARIKKVFKDEAEWVVIVIFITGWITLNAIISFTPRYLVPIAPLLGLLVAKFAGKNKWMAVMLIIIAVPFYFLGVSTNPKEAESNFLRYLSTDSYKESYRLLAKPQFSENEWINLNRKIKTEEGVWWINAKNKDNGAEIILANDTKTYKFNQAIKMVNILGSWKIDWEWNDKELAEAKEMLMEKKKDLEWRYLWVVPGEIQNWPTTLRRIEVATGLNSSAIWERIKLVVPDKYPTPIGWIKDDIKKSEYQEVVSDNAVRIEKKSKVVNAGWKIEEKIIPIRWLLTNY